MATIPAGVEQSDPSMIISWEEAMALVRPLTSLPVSLARQRLDGTLLMDLGGLSPASGSSRGLRGEVSLALEGAWRFEAGSSVLFGSGSSPAFVYAYLLDLMLERVRGISLAPDLPELVLELEGGIRGRSFACVEGHPRWRLGLPDGSWLSCDRGALHHEPAGHVDAPRLSELEEDELMRSEGAAERWGERASTASGRCAGCTCFVQLEGYGKFREYGVCSSPRSLRDGRLVSLRSGCAAFADR